MEKDTIELTRAEREALDKYYTERKKELLDEVFSAVGTILQDAYRIEDNWVGLCDQEWERYKFLYGRNVCEKLIIDLKKIKSKFMEAER